MITAHDPISAYMTSSLHAIEPDISVQQAREKMANEKVRHLPVISAGKLLGIVSARDVMQVEALGLDPHLSEVELAMTAYPDTCEPDTPLAVALATMADRRIGALMVVKDDRLMGIFTDVDAVRLLRYSLLEREPAQTQKATG